MIRRSLVCALASLRSSRFPSRPSPSAVRAARPPARALRCRPTRARSTRPQTQEPDAAVPVDAGVDAAEAKDAADAADAAEVAPPIPFATRASPQPASLSPTVRSTPTGRSRTALGTALTAYLADGCARVCRLLARPERDVEVHLAGSSTPSTLRANGTFTYTTSFALGAEVDVAAVQLVIRYASDNEMKDILINGVSVGSRRRSAATRPSRRSRPTTQFVKGTNTVSFTTGNSGGPDRHARRVRSHEVETLRGDALRPTAARVGSMAGDTSPRSVSAHDEARYEAAVPRCHHEDVARRPSCERPGRRHPGSPLGITSRTS